MMNRVPHTRKEWTSTVMRSGKYVRAKNMKQAAHCVFDRSHLARQFVPNNDHFPILVTIEKGKGLALTCWACGYLTVLGEVALLGGGINQPIIGARISWRVIQ